MEGDQEVDRYQVKITVSDDFPRSLPVVFETAGRIPPDADHHMYGNGSACLFAPGERWRYWPTGSRFVDFLDGPVRSFFIGQALFELTGEWPFGQRSHGAKGIIEAYGEMIRSRNPAVVVRYLEVLSRRKLRPRSPCPCRSGNPMHSCHLPKIASLRAKVPYRDARHALAIVLDAVKNVKRAPTN